MLYVCSMTRINVGIDPKRLTDEHLLAEHRELKRLPYCVEVSIKSGNINHIPKTFRLGKGHVLFFLDKMGYTYFRYLNILQEIRKRGFNVVDYSTNWFTVPNRYFKTYKPTVKDANKVIDRISERISRSRKTVWHYYGDKITKDQAIDILNEKST